MKKILFLLTLAASSIFAQHRGGFGGSRGFSAPHPVSVHPAPIVRSGPVVVASRVYVGGYGFAPYGFYGAYGLWSYSFFYPGYGYIVSAPEPKACQKEKLKDENGKKHEVLACKLPDGSFQVIQPK
jgi:hypothetical protein